MGDEVVPMPADGIRQGIVKPVVRVGQDQQIEILVGPDQRIDHGVGIGGVQGRLFDTILRGFVWTPRGHLFGIAFQRSMSPSMRAGVTVPKPHKIETGNDWP